MGRVRAAQRAEQLVLDPGALGSALETLVADGRIESITDDDGAEAYQTGDCVLPIGATVG